MTFSVDLMTRAGVTEDKIHSMKPELSALVEDFTQCMNRVEEEVRLQKEMINKLVQRIGFLEKRVKQSVTAERRRDYNLVRNYYHNYHTHLPDQMVPMTTD